MSHAETGRHRAPPRRRTNTHGGRQCLTCHHPECEAIDRAIVSGQPLSELSRSYSISHDALRHHRDKHIPRATLTEAAGAHAAAEGARGGDLYQDAQSLRAQAISILSEAREANDLRTALQAIREASRIIEVMGRLRGYIDDSAKINVLFAPAFVTIQAAILTALEPHPAARDAVLRALEHVA